MAACRAFVTARMSVRARRLSVFHRRAFGVRLETERRWLPCVFLPCRVQAPSNLISAVGRILIEGVSKVLARPYFVRGFRRRTQVSGEKNLRPSAKPADSKKFRHTFRVTAAFRRWVAGVRADLPVGTHPTGRTKVTAYDGVGVSSTMFPSSSTVAVVTGLFLLSSLRCRFSSFLAFFSKSFLRFSNW